MAEVSPWRAALRLASFRGVPFEVDSSGRDLGRKVVIHDYPKRDSITGEDMGQKPGTFSIDGYIIGPDYMTARDAFEAALNKAGLGVLVVPWTGQQSVRLISAKASETTKDGGYVKYTLEFIAEAASPSLVQTLDTSSDVATAGTALNSQAQASFSNGFVVTAEPAFVLTRAADLVGKFSDQLDGLTAPLKAQGDILGGYIAQGLALRTSVIQLVTKPAELAAQISGLIVGIRTLAATPADALTALKGALGFGSDFTTGPRSTPARIIEAENQDALVALVRQTAAAEAVQAIADSDFAAYEDAAAVRDDMTARLDVLADAAADAGDDAAFAAISSARQAMIRDVNARGGTLAHLRTVTPLVTVPALVLAHRLFDDVTAVEDNALEIIARNGIRHPGFVPAGKALQVLSDG